VAEEKFRPGFRLSLIDAIVIAVGATLSILLWKTAHIGVIIAFVVGHFFLFCNVFRIARRLELIWSAVFVVVICATTMFEAITFPLGLVVSSIATIVVVTMDMRSLSYHGVFWSRLNPALPDWWAARQSSSSLRSRTAR